MMGFAGVPSAKCGRLFFVHRKWPVYGVLRVMKGKKNAPNLDDWEHFHAYLGRISPSETLQQQQPRKRSYRPWVVTCAQEASEAGLPVGKTPENK